VSIPGLKRAGRSPWSFDEASPDFRIAASRDAWEKTVGFFRKTPGSGGQGSPA
jgi:hypothetical protein